LVKPFYVVFAEYYREYGAELTQFRRPGTTQKRRFQTLKLLLTQRLELVRIPLLGGGS